MLARSIIALFCFLPVFATAQNVHLKKTSTRLEVIATEYVRLALLIGLYDKDFVDAYYGPDSLASQNRPDSSFPKAIFLKKVGSLQKQLLPLLKNPDTSISKRANWIHTQLTAYSRRIKMFDGEKSSFNVQVKELFGVVPPTLSEDHFRGLLARLDRLLPGEGDVATRYQNLASRFIVPKDKVDTMLKATIAASKKKTKEFIQLPTSEDFRLEYVTGKSWSGYNWYQGKYKSLIQLNTDITSYIERIIDVGSHESYPGHHVYNNLLEKKLYNDKGQVEISLYPLFSPQSLIAEGSANYGIEMAFPGNEKIKFISDVLFPLAGMDTTGISLYFQALAIKGKLFHVRTEIARRITEGRMTDTEAIQWLLKYGLFNEKDAARALSFIKKYQGYVINYTYGKDIVQQWIERNGGTANNPAKRWQLFEWLLSNQVTPAELLLDKKK